MVRFDRLLQVTSQFSYADRAFSYATVVTVVCDIAMLQMFMHMYVVANCTTVASL